MKKNNKIQKTVIIVGYQCNNRCQYKKHCFGIHKGYLEKVGNKEFSPIKENFVIQETNDFYHPIREIKFNGNLLK